MDLQNHTLGMKSAEVIMQQALRQPHKKVTVIQLSIVQREST